MALSPEQRRKEETEGYAREMQGKHPVGWFKDYPVQEAQRSGGDRAKDDKVRMKAESEATRREEAARREYKRKNS